MSHIPHFLLVEDEPALLHVLEATITYGGYTADVATSAFGAMQALLRCDYQCILLDLGLPDQDGFDLIRTIRRKSDIPIVVVSGRDTERDKIETLDVGADDFVGKPFLPGELLARLRAVLRRRRDHAAWQVNQDIAVLDESDVKTVDPVRLSPHERTLHRLLRERGGATVRLDEIVEGVWDGLGFRGIEHVRVLVTHLRRKLEEQGSADEIITERGEGYRLIRRQQSAA